MTKPTTTAATPQRGAASGKKANPPETVEGDGGLVRGPTNEPDEVTLPAQQKNHNDQNDRGEPKKPEGEGVGQEKVRPHATLTAGAEGTENRYEGDFMLSAWVSQVFHAKTDLPVATRAVLAALGVNMDQYGRAFMSVREIGVAAGIDSEKTVTKHLKLAEFNGWIIRYHDHQEGSRIRYEALKVK